MLSKYLKIQDSGKSFLFLKFWVAEGNEPKKKQKKNDSDISRVTPSMRNQVDNLASLKGEQVRTEYFLRYIDLILRF